MANRAHFTILQLIGLYTTGWRVQVMLHKILVSSTVLNDSEIDSLPKVINMVATAFEREILWKICRLMQANKVWRIGYNKETYRLYNARPSCPKNRIEGCCLQWCHRLNPDTELKGGSKRERLEKENWGGHSLRMGQGDKKADNRRKENSNTRTKRTKRRRNIRFPNVLSVTMHLCFWCSLTRNDYSTEVINCTYILITA
jgi:hypothetical protein